MSIGMGGNMPVCKPTSITTTLARLRCRQYIHCKGTASHSSITAKRFRTAAPQLQPSSLLLSTTKYNRHHLFHPTPSSHQVSTFTTMTSLKPSLTKPLPLLPLPSSSTTTPNPSQSTTTTPRLIYGTAWKKDRTADLVHLALRSGFRGIDTANQPRHYQEHLVGQGIQRAIADGTISSSREIFLQTKFTAPGGQDALPNCPYNPSDPLEKQVRDSVETSFVNLFGGGSGGGGEEGTGENTGWIDSVVLHSPLDTYSQTFEAWRVLESYIPHRIGRLGIANAPFEVVERLWHEATSPDSRVGIKIPPSIVQNRFFAGTEFDTELRAFCREKGIVYQSFWTLTANNKPDNPRQGRRNLVDTKPVRELADKVGVGKEAAYYCLVLGLDGITILDGTTQEEHMKEDLEGVEKVEKFAESEVGKGVWEACLEGFKDLINEQDL